MLELAEVQRLESLTVKLYTAAGWLFSVKVVGELLGPVEPLIDPGFIVHPVEGNPENWIDPVFVVQFGCIAVKSGAAGILFTVTTTDAVLEHPLDPWPVTIYVLVAAGVNATEFTTELSHE